MKIAQSTVTVDCQQEKVNDFFGCGHAMVIWVVEFSSKGYKIRKIFA